MKKLWQQYGLSQTLWLLFILLGITVSFPRITSAQTNNDYTPLEKIPLITNKSGVVDITSPNSLANFANAVIQIMIGIAIILAVVMVIYGGLMYMTTGSFTEKNNAKDTIIQALTGLLLALSSVAILRTINPDLVQLQKLKDVKVEEFRQWSTIKKMERNPRPEKGELYYCYKQDVVSIDEHDNMCAETKKICEKYKSTDPDSRSQCKPFAYYKDSRADASNANACFGYFDTRVGRPDPYPNEDYGVKCYYNANKCKKERKRLDGGSPFRVEINCQTPEKFGVKKDKKVKFKSTGKLVAKNKELSQVSGIGKNTEATVAKQQAKNACKSDAKRFAQKNKNDTCSLDPGKDRIKGTFDDSFKGCSLEGCKKTKRISSGNYAVYNRMLKNSILNGNPSEEIVRKLLNNQTPTIYTNHGGKPNPVKGDFCKSVTAQKGTCTNIGGLSSDAIKGIKSFNKEFTSSKYCCNCHLTITGGTSWWFHGKQKKDPLAQVNATCHNPTGVSNKLCTGAIDLRKMNGKIKSFLQDKACVVAGQSGSEQYQYKKHFFLNEGTHWHINFNKYSSGC